MKMTALALGRFIGMLVGGGTYRFPDGRVVQIIEPRWVADLLAFGPNDRDRLGFSIIREQGRVILGHNGGEEGVATTMKWWTNSASQLSAVVLCNGDSSGVP